MPEINTMSSSRYIKKEDLQQPTEFTVTEVVEENVAMEGKPADNKWVAHFAESEKGLVLNKTNRENMAYICGKTNTDDWGGEKFTLFNDMSVLYDGKRGGIRIQFQQGGMTQPQQQNYNQASEQSVSQESICQKCGKNFDNCQCQGDPHKQTGDTTGKKMPWEENNG